MDDHEPLPDNDEPVESNDLIKEKSQDPQAPEQVKQSLVAGFFRRFSAFFLDLTILAIPLIIIGFGFKEFWYQLGPRGRFVGYIAFILYFGFGNSMVGSWDTVGKQVLGISVVDRNQNRLPIGRSLLRSFVLASIFIFNGWALPFIQTPLGSILAATILLGGGLALIYGAIFNRITRQSIHDLIVDSYVIQVRPWSDGSIPESHSRHKNISYGLVAFGFLFSLIAVLVPQIPGSFQPTFGIIEEGEMGQMLTIQEEILEQGDHFSVGVRRSNNFNGLTGVESKDLNIQIWTKKTCSKNRAYCVELYNEAARVAFENFEDIESLTGMRVSIINQFDLGFATGNETMGSSLRIEDWKTELNIND